MAVDGWMRVIGDTSGTRLLIFTLKADSFRSLGALLSDPCSDSGQLAISQRLT